jgi:hypothetical protein
MKADFTKGLLTNTQPVNTPAGSYTDAENMRVSGRAKRTEEGNASTLVPYNFIQWGSCAIGDETILLGSVSGKSIIGSLDIEGNWTVEEPVRSGVDVLGIVEPTQVEGKKNWAGERVIYFSTPSGSRRINLDVELPTDDEDFDKVTSLFLEYDLPRTKYKDQTNSGVLLSGVYQFAARLVTDSGATTSFGIISGVIPVVDSSLTGSRDAVEGDPPQTPTNKAIVLEVNNVDTAFKFIELGILTYVGLSNTQKITKSTLIPINGQSTIVTTYRGASDDFGDLTTEEFIVSGVAYSTAKYLAQKDGTLLLGSPVEAEQPDINWFRVAQGIVGKYVIKRIPYAQALNFDGASYTAKRYPTDETSFKMVETSSDPMLENSSGTQEGYKDPLTCAIYKGYRRNEVYSFSITPVFTSGVYGPTVHVPGPAAGNPTSEANPNDGGVLGSYISEEVYPDDRYDGLENTGLRMFKMPDAVMQPIIEGNTETSDCYIRILGVEFSNIVLDPTELQYEQLIAGFIIGRVDRRGQETQLAQGLVRPNVDVYTETTSITGLRTASIGDGFAQWFREMKTDSEADSGTRDAVPDLTDFTFVAPDLIHNLYSPNIATFIKQHSIYKSDPYSAPFAYNISSDDPLWDNRQAPSRHNCSFHNVLGDNAAVNATLDQEEILLDGNPLTQAPFGVPNQSYDNGGKRNVGILKGGKEIQMCSSNGFTWFSTDGAAIKCHRPVNDFYYNRIQSKQNNFDVEWTFTQPTNFRADFVLHTLTRRNTKQYGPLDQMVSMFVDYTDWKGFTGTVQTFNGDTFINKYGLKLSDEAAFIYDASDSGPDYIGDMRAPNANTMLYMWLESDNNYAYRHYVESASYSEENITGSTGTIPYYPAYKQLGNIDTPFGLLSMSAENWQIPGYCKTYNTQYSTQPTVKPYVNTPLEDTERKGSLVNRILYSAQAVQGEKTDAYQIFLPNNYYDVPQEYGELTDVYVNGELYASTSQVQWKLFYNTLATQATSAGEVVLGTGGAFNRPAVPMATVDGGYAGNVHWLHAINTIWGRVIIDKRQGKFFLMRDNLAVISGDLDDAVRLDVQALNDDYDTILVGSEPLRERVFIKAGDTIWSYNLERQMFISRHTWVPRWFFSHGPHLFSNNINAAEGNTGIFKHSAGNTGIFYGKLHEASITIVANAEPTISKLFKNFEIQTKRTTEGGLNLPFDTWNYMEMWNEERNTGLLDIVPKVSTFQSPAPMQVLSSKVKDCYRVIASRDIVIDPSVDIFAYGNQAQHRGDTVLTKWLPKMRGTYMEIKLISDNTQGPLFFYDFTIGLSENIR